MSVRKFAAELRESIRAMKARGTDWLTCDSLIAYLKNVESLPEVEATPVIIERFKFDLQSLSDDRKIEHEHNIEMFRSVIASGQSAIKSAMLLNGGAAIALLAFIGHLATCSTGQMCSNLLPKIPGFARCLLLFASGAAAITLMAGLTYLGQAFYAYGQAHGSKWRINFGHLIRALCIIAAASSFAAFCFGLYSAYQVLVSLSD